GFRRHRRTRRDRFRSALGQLEDVRCRHTSARAALTSITQQVAEAEWCRQQFEAVGVAVSVAGGAERSKRARTFPEFPDHRHRAYWRKLRQSHTAEAHCMNEETRETHRSTRKWP